MLDRLNSDIKNAMKEKNKIRLEALRMLKSTFLENNTSKSPKEDKDVAIAHVKKLKDSLQSYPAGSSEIDKIKAEIDYLVDYVPQPMSKEQVEALITNFLKENEGANFGMVMKHVSPLIKGKFDGREASELVKSMMG